MLRLSIDHEFRSRTWWESGGRALWEAIAEELGGSSVVLEDDVAQSWLQQAGRIPGWNDGHEYAPHPIATSPVGEDDP
jgi:hypothetical protein